MAGDEGVAGVTVVVVVAADGVADCGDDDVADDFGVVEDEGPVELG